VVDRLSLIIQYLSDEILPFWRIFDLFNSLNAGVSLKPYFYYKFTFSGYFRRTPSQLIVASSFQLPAFIMNEWSADVCLYVLEYLSVVDSSRLSCTSKRFLFLVSTYRRLVGAEFGTTLQTMHTRPTAAIVFAKEEKHSVEIPDRVTYACVYANAIQSAYQEDLDCTSDSNLLLLSLPNASVVPFSLDDMSETAAIIEPLMIKPKGYWKLALLFSSHHCVREAALFMTAMEDQLGSPLVLGGICDYGHAVGGGENALSEGGGVFGLLFGGDVPVKAVISRGLKSLTHRGEAQPTSSFVIRASSAFRGANVGAHIVNQIVNTDDEDQTTTLQAMVNEYTVPHFLGIRQEGQDGFKLYDMQMIQQLSENSFLVRDVPAGTSLANAQIDLFDLDGEMCVIDVKKHMQSLKEATADEKILGALMFSCSGRGPQALTKEDMVDARAFNSVFPHVPCTGFYAGGEIGPPALAGRQCVFGSGKVGCYYCCA